MDVSNTRFCLRIWRQSSGESAFQHTSCFPDDLRTILAGLFGRRSLVGPRSLRRRASWRSASSRVRASKFHARRPREARFCQGDSIRDLRGFESEKRVTIEPASLLLAQTSAAPDATGVVAQRFWQPGVVHRACCARSVSG
jgi:hypothetical protein